MTDDADDGTSDRASGDEWPVVESVTEYETPWYDGGYDLVEQPDGSRKRYYWAALPPAVVVVPVTDGEVLFVEQYRPVVRETQLELPAGIVEGSAASETPRAAGEAGDSAERRSAGSRAQSGGRESYTTAGARELREETGFDPAGTSLLQEVSVATGVLRHDRAYVFAEGLQPVERSLDDNEFLSVVPVPVEEALERARARPTNDATVQGLLLARAEDLL